MTPPLPNNFDPAVLDAILTVDLNRLLGSYRIGRRTSTAVLRMALLSIYRTQGIPTTGYMRSLFVGISYNHMVAVFSTLRKNGLITCKSVGFGPRCRMLEVTMNTEKLLAFPRLTWKQMTEKQHVMSRRKAGYTQKCRAKKKLNAKPVTSSLCACQ